jgi:multisubunit Na+/H+ antiporter MnhB subunit
MNIMGLAVFALGIVLLIFGFSASESLSSDVSRFFTGTPSNRALWMVIGGVISVVAGLFVAIRSTREQ